MNICICVWRGGQAFSNGLVLLLDTCKEDASGKNLALAATAGAMGAASASTDSSSFDSSSFSVLRFPPRVHCITHAFLFLFE